MKSEMAGELYNIMDALAALTIDLECEPHHAGETLVLSAKKSREACAALVSARASIKKLVDLLDGKESQQGPRH
jgi:hypothetical protein